MSVKKLSDKLKSAPTATSLSGLSMLLSDSSGGFAKMQGSILLGSLLSIGSANTIIHHGGTAASKATWLAYMTKATDTWAIPNASAKDTIVVIGTTSDTGQAVNYFATVIETLSNSNVKVKPYLLLLEGEPPLWGPTSST